MSETRYQLYRHKNNPEIEYYVQEYPVYNRLQVSEPLVPHRWTPEIYLHKNAEAVVRIKCPRNARHPQYDYPTVESMPPGPDMPTEEFMRLYERVA